MLLLTFYCNWWCAQTPANATQVSFYSRLQGANITATWSIADVTIVQLDNTLRNVIRTNVTDIEIWNRDHTSQYHQGSDFSVLSPKTANNAIVCDLKVLQPYVVKRLHGGRIAAGEQVLLSYDFLPGKVDVEGHSTPNAFAEPECEPSCLLLLPAVWQAAACPSARLPACPSVTHL